ncbi:MAG: PEFG-CTERM sorting domain-containing protein [Candidatus Nitrosothermus koennekii]|nr:MAG: PEFG-CTERM sorting domain-containing protein [Candidatus Nitrosothermus koennekii]
MSNNMHIKHNMVIALVFTIFVIAMTYNNAYAQYGGGGGAGAFTIMNSFIERSSGQNPQINTENTCEIDKISLAFSRDPGEFTLSVLEITKPANIPDAPNTVLEYCRITLPSYVNALITQATLDISIPKSDLGDGILKLYKYDEADKLWREIPLNKVDEDANNVYYRGTIGGFSFFALSVEKVEMPPEMVLFTQTFTVEGFDVPATITNGKVDSISVNKDEKSMNILLTGVEEDTTLTIEIPRGLLDSKNPDGTDTEFSVIIDGDLTEYQERTTDEKRILTIEVPAFSEEVTVMGTFVVPEFGIIAMMILAVGITGTLIVSRKYINI